MLFAYRGPSSEGFCIDHSPHRCSACSCEELNQPNRVIMSVTCSQETLQSELEFSRRLSEGVADEEEHVGTAPGVAKE